MPVAIADFANCLATKATSSFVRNQVDICHHLRTTKEHIYKTTMKLSIAVSLCMKDQSYGRKQQWSLATKESSTHISVVPIRKMGSTASDSRSWFRHTISILQSLAATSKCYRIGCVFNRVNRSIILFRNAERSQCGLPKASKHDAMRKK